MPRPTAVSNEIIPKLVIIRHVSGSKANQIEEFPIDLFKEISVGRTATSQIKYHPDSDDLVSRQHATITQDENDPCQFTITDHNSRNGTFVNKQRIIGLARVVPGDVIQLGAGGPEFQFDLDPRPDDLMRRTRAAAGEAPRTEERLTRVNEIVDAHPTVGTAAKTSIGRRTVEMLVASSQGRTQKVLFFSVGGLVVLLAILVSFFYVNRQNDLQEQRNRDQQLQAGLTSLGENTPEKTAAQIAASNLRAVVMIEVGWKLINAGSGKQIYHRYVREKDKNGQERDVALYIRYVQDGQVLTEPFLTEDDGGGINRPIGSRHTGSGFVVSSDGFILTNRHVAATWYTRYGFPQGSFPGYMIDVTTGQQQVGVIQNLDWVPANSQFLERKPLGGKSLEGVHTYLDVTFAKSDLRHPAQLVASSNKHDVSMVKVEIPSSLQKVAISKNPESVVQGQQISVMGYPGVSPEVVIATDSQDPFNRSTQMITVPDPTIDTGIISKILRGQQAPSGRSQFHYFSQFGDSYQLNLNATGMGNSGGPAFDEKGEVIGIFYAEIRGDAMVTFAIPIRYGLELMGPEQVIK